MNKMELEDKKKKKKKILNENEICLFFYKQDLKLGSDLFVVVVLKYSFYFYFILYR